MRTSSVDRLALSVCVVVGSFSSEFETISTINFSNLCTCIALIFLRVFKFGIVREINSAKI